VEGHVLKALIFDCDGVIADNEPLHLAMFQRVLAEDGLTLTAKDYYDTYLGMDDKGCFGTFLARHDRPADAHRIAELIERKARYFNDALARELRLFPGVVALVTAAKGRYPLAVASGALRHEIDLILAAGGLQSAFSAIVSAEDVTAGKPDPEGFRLALARINAARPGTAPIGPRECVVIEDSIAGVEAARAAQMRCLAVTNSYAEVELRNADRVVAGLDQIGLADLEALCDARTG
jgi:HAD superfamily hydrolase (TIGR01509 family)